MSESKEIAGADGCRAGWLLVRAAAAPSGKLRILEVCLVPDFGSLIYATRDCSAVAVDVPIGLSDTGMRRADFEARALIGPRRSSVFPPPARPLLSLPDSYTEINAASAAIRAGLSRQSFNILPKIREADAVMTPAMQERVTESHPEVSFWALKGGHVLRPKRHLDGRHERLDLLAAVFGDAIRTVRPPSGASWDDLYDAAVLAWTAARTARGTSVHVPSQPQYDSRGLRMEIVY